jgi:hypothetical protein
LGGFSMQLDQKIERNPNFIFRMILDEAILVPIRKEIADLNALYTLNEVGAFVWQQLDQPQTLGEIQTNLLAEYEADPDTTVKDLQSYISDMLGIDALRLV